MTRVLLVISHESGFSNVCIINVFCVGAVNGGSSVANDGATSSHEVNGPRTAEGT